MSAICFDIYVIVIMSSLLLMTGCKTVKQNHDKEEPETLGFALTASLQGDKTLVGRTHVEINEYMNEFGWAYTEHPNMSEKDHPNEEHCRILFDKELKQYIFRFINHANDEILDGDRGSKNDRQRNEMKSLTGPYRKHLNGNYEEVQVLKWKFRLPKGFRATKNFCHIHQLKAQEGNNGAPLITVSVRADKDGGNSRIQVIHTGDRRDSSRGIIIDNLSLVDFENEWIEVTTEMYYAHNGTFKIRMVRIGDGKVIVDKCFDNIDLWRSGAKDIRSKFGIYRSYGRRMKNNTDRPDNGIKDEILDFADFRIYEKK